MVYGQHSVYVEQLAIFPRSVDRFPNGDLTTWTCKLIWRKWTFNALITTVLTGLPERPALSHYIPMPVISKVYRILVKQRDNLSINVGFAITRIWPNENAAFAHRWLLEQTGLLYAYSSIKLLVKKSLDHCLISNLNAIFKNIYLFPKYNNEF